MLSSKNIYANIIYFFLEAQCKKKNGYNCTYLHTLDH